MTKQTLKWMIGLLCISVALTACKEKIETTEVVRAIKTITVSDQATEQVRKFSGLVAAVDSSDLSFQVAGQVASVAVDIGDHVQKGQVLAVLDREPFELDVEGVASELEKARAQVVNATAEFERQKRVYAQGAGAQKDLDRAEYKFRAAKTAVNYQISRLNQAKRNLSKTSLKSPYSGTIASREVNAFEEVKVGQKVFEIDAKGKMEVQLAVPETTINRIAIDDPTTITFPTIPGESEKGRISFIGSAAVKSNAFPVKVELINPNKKIKPGMTAEVNLFMADKNQQPGYLVPIQAILPAVDANQGYIFVYNAKTSSVKKTPCRFSGAQHGQAIVDEGLAAGDIIAVAGASFLADGLKVKLMKQ